MNTKLRAALAFEIGSLIMPAVLVVVALATSTAESFGIARNQNLLTGVLDSAWAPTILEPSFWTVKGAIGLVLVSALFGVLGAAVVFAQRYQDVRQERRRPDYRAPKKQKGLPRWARYAYQGGFLAGCFAAVMSAVGFMDGGVDGILLMWMIIGVHGAMALAMAYAAGGIYFVVQLFKAGDRWVAQRIAA